MTSPDPLSRAYSTLQTYLIRSNNRMETPTYDEAMAAADLLLDAARAAAPSDGLREAAVQLRAAAVKAGAHIVVTNDYPDGVKAFGILCDAIDVMDAALESPTTEQREGLDANG